MLQSKEIYNHKQHVNGIVIQEANVKDNRKVSLQKTLNRRQKLEDSNVRFLYRVTLLDSKVRQINVTLSK